MFTDDFTEGIHVLIKFTNGRSKVGRSVATSQDSEGVGPTPTRGAYRPPMKVLYLEKTQRPREEAQRNACNVQGLEISDGSTLRRANIVTHSRASQDHARLQHAILNKEGNRAAVLCMRRGCPRFASNVRHHVRTQWREQSK